MKPETCHRLAGICIGGLIITAITRLDFPRRDEVEDIVVPAGYVALSLIAAFGVWKQKLWGLVVPVLFAALQIFALLYMTPKYPESLRSPMIRIVAVENSPMTISGLCAVMLIVERVRRKRKANQTPDPTRLARTESERTSPI